MGIPGLTTYVSNNAGIFYRDHALHDTLLLIDGNSLASQIYLELTVTNSAFGGDYERYQHSVEKFMKMLMSCNILPIVVFDGGYETRKLKTTVSRLKNSISGVSNFKSVNQQNNVKLFPMFMKEVFKTVLRYLHIPCVQSDLEADFDLVYLSRKFQCPVLSYDSDFYLNDIEYIPFFNIQLKGQRDCQESSTGKAVFCQIYRVENLFRHFGGLSKEYIPLLQCMLGNDYISHMHFKNFLAQLNFRFSSGRKSPVSKRLAVLIKWCRGQKSLESAVSKIIENLKNHHKTEAIKHLKRSIHDYGNEECILYPYVMEQVVKYNLTEKLKKLQEVNRVDSEEDEVIRYDEDSDDESNATGSTSEDNTDSGSDEDLDVYEESEEKVNSEEEDGVKDSGDESEENENHVEQSEGGDDDSSSRDVESISTNNEPNRKHTKKKQFNANYLKLEWLVHEFRHGKLSPHLANMINLGKIYLLPLRENIKLDSVHKASFPILSIIAKLLLDNATGTNKLNVLSVYTRELSKMRVIRLNYKSVENYEISQLDNINIFKMPQYKENYRRGLLLNYLKLYNIDPNLFNGDAFPQEWNLFLISLIYWCNTSPQVNSYHVKCLVLSIIYLNIIQARCGYFETMGNFNRKYAKKLNEFKTEIEKARIERKKSKKYKKNKNVTNGSDEKDQTEHEKNLINLQNVEENNMEPSGNKHNDKIYPATRGLQNILKNTTNVKELLLLYEKFFHFSHLDEKLRSNHTCFNKDVIHVLSEYQSVFYAITMLNSILFFPFDEIDMSQVYSGTFLYNLYCKIFNKENNIGLLFEHCDEMFGIYNFIENFVEENTDSDVFRMNLSKPKRKKKKKDKIKIEESENEVESDREENMSEEELIDSDNIYSILQNVHIM